jgi:thiamine-monophosphate kinase
MSWVLAGGEDHALAATFPAGTALPPGFLLVGEVVEGDPGVVVDDLPYPVRGFDHFG